MNRRNTLELLLGIPKQPKKSITMTNSFDPYTGPWGFAEAAHLLRRTTFGPTKIEIKQAVEDGLEVTLNRLFGPTPNLTPPIYYDFELDPAVPLGQSWINDPALPIIGLSGARKRSYLSWKFQAMRDNRMHIIEKLWLFWHNHFVVSGNSSGIQLYNYHQVLRRNALGNFKSFVEEITIDSSMLVYLNGTQNRKNGPNENYARELLELFTLGKGPTVGPGDYTHYTEDDIIQIARALTGWKHSSPVPGGFDPNLPRFVDNRHDTGTKVLSSRFDNQVIENEGEDEYKRVIDIIFQKPQVATFICEKLYRWFVHPEISPEAESNVIIPMAELLIDNEYEIKDVLIALLSSEHFYDASVRGCMLVHPLDHLFKVLSTLQVPMPENFELDYSVMNFFRNEMEDAGMGIHLHPTVAGWKAFYQAPQFDKLWINSFSLGLRQNLIQRIVSGFNRNGFRLELDVLNFAATLENPNDPNELIREIGNLIFVQELNEEQITALKEILIPGLPDFEWTVEYGAYVGGDLELEDAVKSKLKSLLSVMLNMPEFHFI